MNFRLPLAAALMAPTALGDAQAHATAETPETMSSDKVTDIVARNRQLAQTQQISGTPGFLFETRMLRGYLPLDGMRQVVEQVRSES